MPKGGARPGAGRNPDVYRSMLAARAQESLEKFDRQPLDFLLEVMNTGSLPLAMRLQAAGLAAPYVHPRLSANLHAQVKEPSSGAREFVGKLIDGIVATGRVEVDWAGRQPAFMASTNGARPRSPLVEPAEPIDLDFDE